MERLTVPEAAATLGISEEAVRGRLKRGTLAKERDAGGTVYVLLESDQTRRPDDRARPDGDQQNDQSERITELKDQVGYLRQQLDIRTEELRRKDHIIAALTERIPELEAPREGDKGSEETPQESGENLDGEETQDASADAVNGTSEASAAEEASRPWWRRLFS